MTDKHIPPVDTAADMERAHVAQRTLDAPCATVFGAFRNPEQLARWWGPKGFSNSFEEFDFRKGGVWRFTMHGPDGKDYSNESRFIDIVENKRVVIEHLSDHHFILTVTFTALGNATSLTWKQLFDTAHHYREIADFVSQANEQNLDRLETLVGKTSGG